MVVYFLCFAGIHCAYPLRDGQAELSWIVGYFTSLETNWVLCRITSLIEANTLPLSQNVAVCVPQCIYIYCKIVQKEHIKSKLKNN